MNIIVYHPKSPENVRTLKKRVATIHAEAALQYIDKLTCPKEQKIELVNAIKNKCLPE